MKLTPEEYLIEKLKKVDPGLYPMIKDELKAHLHRRKFQLIKGGRYEPNSDTLKGNCTL